MLGNIISQLYRIADLLKDKKLVDKDSSNSSQSENEDEVKVKPIFSIGKEYLIGFQIKEKYFNIPETIHETEVTTLGQIFPECISDIIEIVSKNENIAASDMDFYIEYSTEILRIGSKSSSSINFKFPGITYRYIGALDNGELSAEIVLTEDNSSLG